MKRDIGKLIEAYNRRERAQENSTKGAFYVTDVEQILVRNGLEGINGALADMILRTIFDSLSAGYMVGYRTAQRDARRRNAGA